MRKASNVPEVEVEDLLDPNRESNDQDRRAVPERVKNGQLNSLDPTAMLFPCQVGSTVDAVNKKVLVDTGASHTFMSEATARSVPIIARHRSLNPLRVELPNGDVIWAFEKVEVLLRLNTWTGKVKMWLLDISEYDIIMGKDWLWNNRAVIHVFGPKLSIRGRNGSSHEVEPLNPRRRVKTPGAGQLLCSAGQMARYVRKRSSEAWLWIFQEKASPKPMFIESCEDDGVRRVLESKQHVFCDELPEERPIERKVKHSIDTGDAEPINLSPYPLSREKREELTKQINYLLERGLIRPSASPWGFPVLFVRKADGSWRMCIDYRALNRISIKNGYPLPRIDELLDIVGRAKFLSKLDLLPGYWQIPLDENAIPKTAFNTLFGKYEWLVMPFGLTGAPGTFQSIMNEALRDHLGKDVLVYLDDILIFTDTVEDHLRVLEDVLSALERNQLYAKPSKCVFMQQDIEFCGHVVGSGYLRPQAAKLDVIKEWPRPRDAHEVRQFVGLATYYRRFVEQFARIAAPLHDLLRTPVGEERERNHPITWTAACEYAFQELKRRLTSAPVLNQPDVSKPFTIETDASEWALGYVLQQEDEYGQLHPIAYDGRKLRGAELNYPTHEKELLAIKEALRTWDRYIENGTQTTVVTDHEHLQYLQTTLKYSKRLARWVDEFQSYSLRIRYRRGSDAVVPDTISRRPDFVEATKANIAAEDGARQLLLAGEWEARDRVTLSALQGHSEQDWYPAMVAYLRDGTPASDSSLDRYIRNSAQEFRLKKSKFPFDVEDDLLVHLNNGFEAPYLEIPARKDFVRRMHEEYGHLGHPGLLGAIGHRAWWPTMREDIRETMQRCPNCQVSQGSKAALEREDASTLMRHDLQPFERWALDLIGPLPATPNHNRWILTAIDYATGWPLARALPEATEEIIARFLHDDIYTNYGAPREFLTDNGPNLLSRSVEYYIRLLEARHRTTTPHHPRTNGKVENFNGLLGRMLTRYLMGKPTRLWDEYLSQALFASRIRIHSVTGQSPFFLLYGIHPRLPSDSTDTVDLDAPLADWEQRLLNVNHVRSQANELLLNRALRTKRIHDETVTQTSFDPRTWVLVRNEGPEKFQSKWFGPYRVLKSHPLGTYALEEPGGRVLRNLVNGSRLIEAHVDNPEKLWSSSAFNRALKRQGLSLQHPVEVRHLLDAEDPLPPSYSELSTMSREEWDEHQRTGVRYGSAGEGNDDDLPTRLLRKTRPRMRRVQQQRLGTSSAAAEAGQPARWEEDGTDAEEASDSTSTASDSDDVVSSPEEDVRSVRDASLDFDGPFAVVIRPNERR